MSATRIRESVSAPNLFTGYGGGGDRPLASYAVLVSVWVGWLAGFLGLVKVLRRPLPELTGG